MKSDLPVLSPPVDLVAEAASPERSEFDRLVKPITDLLTSDARAWNVNDNRRRALDLAQDVLPQLLALELPGVDAYRHATGFVAMFLAGDRISGGVQLNVWLPNDHGPSHYNTATERPYFNVGAEVPRLPAEDAARSKVTVIHDHVFEFTSRLLHGAKTETRFDVAEVPDGHFDMWTVYYASYDDTYLRAAGKSVSAVVESVVARAAGDEYVVPAGVFHDTYVRPAELTATLLCRSPQQTEEPRVIGPRYAAMFPAVRETVEGQPRSEMLKLVLDHLPQ